MRDHRYALISVSDKSGIETIGRGLVDFGFEILSTGGTASALWSAGVPVTPLSEFTGFPEILGGRVKTLHPRVYAGILARDIDAHLEDLDRIQCPLIDLVVVNLYPFELAAAVSSTSLPQLVEEIDIGGVCLLRAAAKNFERVTVVCDPKDYEIVLWHFSHDGEAPPEVRFELAIKAYNHTAAYDGAIARTLPEFEVESGRRRGIAE